MRLPRAACRQVLTTEAKTAVVEELKQLCAEKKIVVLRDLFVKTTSKRREPTVTVLSESVEGGRVVDVEDSEDEKRLCIGHVHCLLLCRLLRVAGG